MRARFYEWRSKADWKQSTEDAEYFGKHPLPSGPDA
jgi:hypothetical protein